MAGNRNPCCKIPKCSLAEDFNALFEAGTGSDVVLHVQGRYFFSHKTVLIARSKLFATMFAKGMPQNNQVDIKDIQKPDVFADMLKYIYTGFIPKLDANSGELLSAAQKYGLERLKAACEDALCRAIQVSNAADTLILAEDHDASQLKAHAIRFINNNRKEVTKTEGWESLVRNHQFLTAELYLALEDKQEPVNVVAFENNQVTNNPQNVYEIVRPIRAARTARISIGHAISYRAPYYTS